MRCLLVAHLLSGYAAMEVNALRGQFDPRTAAALAAHVTLAGAVDTDAPLPQLEAIIGQCAAEVEPFDLVIEGVTTFLPTTNTVYLPIRPADRLTALHDLLIARLGWHEQFPYVPHVTVAEFLPPAETEQVERELEPIRVFVEDRLDTLTLLERNGSGRWAPVLACHLRRRKKAA
jgi:2'-5' RNA ligase